MKVLWRLSLSPIFEGFHFYHHSPLPLDDGPEQSSPRAWRCCSVMWPIPSDPEQGSRVSWSQPSKGSFMSQHPLQLLSRHWGPVTWAEQSDKDTHRV